MSLDFSLYNQIFMMSFIEQFISFLFYCGKLEFQFFNVFMELDFY